ISQKEFGVVSQGTFERIEHSFYFGDLIQQLFVGRIIQILQVMCEQHVIVGFGRGSSRYVYKSSKVSITSPSTSFSQIGGNGCTRAAQLAGNPESLIGRKAPRLLIDC